MNLAQIRSAAPEIFHTHKQKSHGAKNRTLRSSLPAVLEMWANAQRDGRPAEYRWRPLLNAAVWLTPTTRVPCSNCQIEPGDENFDIIVKCVK